MQKPFYILNLSWFKIDLTGQSLILLIGGLFLLYESTLEIHHKIEDLETENNKLTKGKETLSKVVIQITLINLVFSFDSILTAVGMTTGVQGALLIMIISVVLSMIIMMAFANPVGNFVDKHPTIQMLGLSFLILMGFMLITEAANLSNTIIFNQHIGSIPKGYLYFAISFSLGVEALNMKLRKNKYN